MFIVPRTLVLAVAFAAATVAISDPSLPTSNDFCECHTSESCSCCARLFLNDSVFQLNDTACAEISYQPKKEIIDVDLRLNGRVILKEDVNIHDLSKECVGVPYIKKAAELCAIFSSVEINTTEVGACVDITLELLESTVLDVRVGCFDLPVPDATDASGPRGPGLVEEEMRAIT